MQLVLTYKSVTPDVILPNGATSVAITNATFMQLLLNIYNDPVGLNFTFEHQNVSVDYDVLATVISQTIQLVSFLGWVSSAQSTSTTSEILITLSGNIPSSVLVQLSNIPNVTISNTNPNVPPVGECAKWIKAYSEDCNSKYKCPVEVDPFRYSKICPSFEEQFPECKIPKNSRYKKITRQDYEDIDCFPSDKGKKCNWRKKYYELKKD